MEIEDALQLYRNCNPKVGYPVRLTRLSAKLWYGSGYTKDDLCLAENRLMRGEDPFETQIKTG